MYINSIDIKNPNGASLFGINFNGARGFNVIIGENATDKSDLLKMIALSLNIGDSEYGRDLPFEYRGKISVDLEIGKKLDKTHKTQFYIKGGYNSAAIGAYRSTSGDAHDFAQMDTERNFHFSLFYPDYAPKYELALLLGASNGERYECNSLKEPQKVFLLDFINRIGLFSDGRKLYLYEGYLFLCGNDADKKSFSDEWSAAEQSMFVIFIIILNSIINSFDWDKVFPTETPETIDLPGVVLIDDFEAHLSPTTQIRFSEWLVKTFPQIQFIVTTNSPFVCRACDGGTIWKLERGESGAECNEVTGVEKDRILYGNILDAYSTTFFGGEEITRSNKGKELYGKLTALLKKSYKDEASLEEEAEIRRLRDIFITGK